MIKFWKKRIQDGLVTENNELDESLALIKKELKKHVKKKFAGSLAIRMVDSGSCNACGYLFCCKSTPCRCFTS